MRIKRWTLLNDVFFSDNMGNDRKTASTNFCDTAALTFSSRAASRHCPSESPTTLPNKTEQTMIETSLVFVDWLIHNYTIPLSGNVRRNASLGL